jgi:transcriptional regulator GlxA family with amidase domain
MEQDYIGMQYREVMRSFKADGVKSIFRKLKKIRLEHIRLMLLILMKKLKHKVFKRS